MQVPAQAKEVVQQGQVREGDARHRHSCSIAQAGTKGSNHYPSKGRLISSLLTISVFSQRSDPGLHGCTTSEKTLNRVS